MYLTDLDIEMFWKYIDKKGPNECWPWLGGKHRDGHGVFNCKSLSRTLIAHRVSFFLKNGYLPDHKKGRMVIHDCENHVCQNDAHLVDGTAKKNNNYPNSLRGRRGEKNGKAKLTSSIVIAILKSKDKNSNIARKYKVSPCTVSAIKRKIRWCHVKI